VISSLKVHHTSTSSMSPSSTKVLKIWDPTERTNTLKMQKDHICWNGKRIDSLQSTESLWSCYQVLIGRKKFLMMMVGTRTEAVLEPLMMSRSGEESGHAICWKHHNRIFDSVILKTCTMVGSPNRYTSILVNLDMSSYFVQYRILFYLFFCTMYSYAPHMHWYIWPWFQKTQHRTQENSMWVRCSMVGYSKPQSTHIHAGGFLWWKHASTASEV
jgi:hypothetical protein